VAESTSEKGNRWWLKIVMGLAFLAFVGISMAPIIGSFFQAGPTPGSSASPMATASPTAMKAELESRAKGYESVLQREPENQSALKGLLQTRLELGDEKGAIEPLEKLVKLNPQETLYGVLLAQAKQRNQDFEGAAQTYRAILTTKPGEIEALQGLAGLLVAQKRPEAAIGLLQDALKSATQLNQAQPGTVDVVSVQIILGGVFDSQSRYDEAIAAYDEAAKLNKQDFRPVYGKAVVLKKQGKTDEATALFTKAAELAPAKYRDQIKAMANPAPAAPTGEVPNAVTPAVPSQDILPTQSLPAPTGEAPAKP
jgi:tetratricopeptide (TPR) repeat protein